LRLPREVAGHDLARALSKFGYVVTRQTGSHMRLTSRFKGTEHHVTIPAHNPLRVGTFSQILSDISAYLQMEREVLLKALFD
jgi:predicted RNA binding protein YcfA (HicA-like mRNA interferase family)